MHAKNVPIISFFIYLVRVAFKLIPFIDCRCLSVCQFVFSLILCEKIPVKVKYRQIKRGKLSLQIISHKFCGFSMQLMIMTMAWLCNPFVSSSTFSFYGLNLFIFNRLSKSTAFVETYKLSASNIAISSSLKCSLKLFCFYASKTKVSSGLFSQEYIW